MKGNNGRSRRRRRKKRAAGAFGEVASIRYTHLDDGEFYEHEFGPDVMMIAASDGSLRIEKPGSTVWSDL